MEEAQRMIIEATPQTLTQIHQRLQSVLEAIDTDLAMAADRLGTIGLEGAETRAILNELCQQHADVVDFVTASEIGLIVTVEPEQYRGAEGTDLPLDGALSRMRATGRPIMSHTYAAAEGFTGFTVHHPVFNAEGVQIGSVGAVLNAPVFLGKHIEEEVKGTPYEGWVLQPDGRIIYDIDQLEIGRNVFKHIGYSQFRELRMTARRMVDSPVGQGQYRFVAAGFGSIHPKKCHWVTIGLHGTEWRVIVAQPIHG